MFAARLTCLRTLPVMAGLRPMLTHSGTPLAQKACPPLLKPHQGFATKVRAGFGRGKTLKDQFKEAVFDTASDTAIKIDSMGRMILAGGAATGLGALCYYGLGMSNEVGAIEKAVFWPQHVKDRIHSTYMYFAGSVGMTALSAVAVSRSPALMGLMMSGSKLLLGASLTAQFGAIMLVQSISYEESPMLKHLAWMSHAGLLGAVLAPLTLLGGPLLMRAAWCTAGVVGSLSMVAMCAPSEEFLYMGGPLGVGLGVVFTSTLGSWFLPRTTALGAGLYSVAVYVGLLLFSAALLYDTQKVIKRAETYPLYGVQEYDPINASMDIYLDTLHIFWRLAMILADDDRRRK